MPRLPGLDGLRAIAVLSVCLYHGGVDELAGGFLGVDVFFVLSGFLITALLLEEQSRRGRVDMRRFYLRRARRLLPALVVVLLVVSAAAVLVYRDAVGQLRTDVPAALAYVSNWWYVVADTSYFEAIGRPPLLQHLWSLAVEEQFYLLWPVALLLLARRGRGTVAVVALAGALASTALLVVLSWQHGYPAPTDPSPVYFGTHTHAMGLLLGAALAAVWAPWRMTPQRQRRSAPVLDGAGLLGLGCIGWMFWSAGAYDPVLYSGGFLALSAGAALAVAALAHPHTWLGLLLGTPPLRWIGERSYGIYLWHWPVFLVTRPLQDVPLPEGPQLLAVRLTITVALAALSYRFVELPIRQGALSRWWFRLRFARGGARLRPLLTGLATGLPVVLVAAFVAATLWRGPAPPPVSLVLDGSRPSDAGPRPASAPPSTSSTAPTPTATPPASRAPRSAPRSSPSPAPSRTASRAPSPSPSTSAARPVPLGRVSMIGDSVLLVAQWALEERFDDVTLDVAVSRQADGVLEAVRSAVDGGRLGRRVVVHTGTNGIVTEDQLREVLRLLADRQRVVVVNNAMPDPYEGPNNETFAAVVPDYPNARLLDWHRTVEGNPEYVIVEDRTHPSARGARALAQHLEDALRAP